MRFTSKQLNKWLHLLLLVAMLGSLLPPAPVAAASAIGSNSTKLPFDHPVVKRFQPLINYAEEIPADQLQKITPGALSESKKSDETSSHTASFGVRNDDWYYPAFYQGTDGRDTGVSGRVAASPSPSAQASVLPSIHYATACADGSCIGPEDGAYYSFQSSTLDNITFGGSYVGGMIIEVYSTQTIYGRMRIDVFDGENWVTVYDSGQFAFWETFQWRGGSYTGRVDKVRVQHINDCQIGCSSGSNSKFEH